mmetsp:Transcript_90480/g.286720  ORF Transcript_90480/g.286720 Transcript_90480/m.286720 type:complete len:243 (-) Transcript_90480:52-780(-)
MANLDVSKASGARFGSAVAMNRALAWLSSSMRLPSLPVKPAPQPPPRFINMPGPGAIGTAANRSENTSDGSSGTLALRVSSSCLQERCDRMHSQHARDSSRNCRLLRASMEWISASPSVVYCQISWRKVQKWIASSSLPLVASVRRCPSAGDCGSRCCWGRLSAGGASKSQPCGGPPAMAAALGRLNSTWRFTDSRHLWASALTARSCRMAQAPAARPRLPATKWICKRLRNGGSRPRLSAE